MRIYQVIFVMLLFGCAPKTQLVKSREYVAIDRVELICDTATLELNKKQIDSLKRENHLLRVEIDKLKKLNALLKVKKEVERIRQK